MSATRRAIIIVLLAVLAAAPLHAAGEGTERAGHRGTARREMPDVADMSGLIKRIDEEAPETLATPIKILLVTTILSILPAILLLTTSFTRIVIVLAFIRRALTTRNIPPSTVIVGLAVFLSLFVMGPTIGEINQRAIRPYAQGSLNAQQAIDEGIKPLRTFMFRQTTDSELGLFVSMSGMSRPETRADVPTHVLIPAFVISELKKSFELGFMLFLPFLILDLIVASILLSMGMMMLPPIIVSAPLKILLFVLVDGWHLVAESLVFSFGGV